MARDKGTGRTTAAKSKARSTVTNPAPKAVEGTEPTAWDNVPDTNAGAPWKRPGLSTADVFTMLAKEAKACLYELLRAHAEYFYERSGWPSDPNAWKALERERDTVVGANELQYDERYGITYAALRWSRNDYTAVELIPLREPTPHGRHPLEVLWIRWGSTYFDHAPEDQMIPAVLQRYEYAEELKEEIRAAFADFADFRIGHGAAKDFIERLRKDEQGGKAIAMIEEGHKVLSARIDGMLNQLFGIERDFTHLLHAACWTFGTVLLQQREEKYSILGEYANQDALRNFNQEDTQGTAPYTTYNATRTGSDGSTVPFNLDRWATIYLQRVDAITQRWRNKEHPDVDTRLDTLRENVRTWDRTTLGAHALPQQRAEVEAAQQKIVEGIRARQTAESSPSEQRPLERIEWKGSVQQLAWMLRELAEKGWIGAQTHKGNTTKWKAGDINASAFAKAMAPHFEGMNLGTLERELKAEGGTVPAQDVEGWQIPKLHE